MTLSKNKAPGPPDPGAPKTEVSHGLPRLVSDRGESVGMDERPFAPLSTYENELDRSADAAVDNARTFKPTKSFELVRASDMTFADPEFAIAGLVEIESLGAIFGKPGSGKSFIALDMACCVATGTRYHGRNVLQGAVIYIAGEGHNGNKRRLMAWEKHHGVGLSDAPLHFSRRAANLLDAAAADAVIAAIDRVAQTEGVTPRLVVIDTVARNFGVGDENSTKDMSAFVAGVDSIKHQYPGCSVLLVHHTGHGEGDRARGSSVLIGALDAEYRVELADGITSLTCTKMKEGAIAAPIAFKAHSVEIGRTAGNVPTTSLAFEEIAALGKTKGRARMSAANQMALDTFLRAKRDAGVADDLATSVHVEVWRKAFYASSTADNADAKKVAFQRARKALVEGGYLAVTDDFYRLARLPEGKA